MSSFTVSPMSQNFKLEPGKLYRGTISIAVPANATSDFRYRATVTPYSVIGVEYKADLVTMSDMSQIANWITIEEPTGVVKPNETKELGFMIKVPETAPAGGQYATIAVSSNDFVSETGAVTMQDVFEIASVLYADVAGETVHSGEILENNVPGFVAEGAPVVSAMIRNTGNVHDLATVKILAKNALTGQVMYPVADKDNGEFTELIMPGTKRFVTREITGLPTLGILEITQDVSFLGQVSPNTKVVIFCPIWFLVLVGLTLAAIIGVIWWKIAKRHKLKHIVLDKN